MYTIHFRERQTTKVPDQKFSCRMTTASINKQQIRQRFGKVSKIHPAEVSGGELSSEGDWQLTLDK